MPSSRDKSPRYFSALGNCRENSHQVGTSMSSVILWPRASRRSA